MTRPGRGSEIMDITQRVVGIRNLIHSRTRFSEQIVIKVHGINLNDISKF